MYNEKSIKIAIIDDNPDYLFLTSKFLSDFNKNILIKTYSTPEKFLDDFFGQRDKFDAIISDFDMDNYTGLDLLSLIRQSSTTIPFILYTGLSREDLRNKAKQLGVDFCVIKESNNKEMSSKIIDFLSQKFDL